jgi:NAD(P)H-hydrate epimerase
VTLDDVASAQLLPARDGGSHKGTHGTLLCLCGSLDYAGAALLAAGSAARAGAGLVALAVPASLQPLFAGRVLEAITLGLPETGGGDFDAGPAFEVLTARHADALLCGSGWSETPGHERLLLALLRQPGRDPDAASREGPPPMVIDGSALNILARTPDWWVGVARPCVLTPHPGEFARLAGHAITADDAERRATAVEAAERFGQVVILKGARTVVAAPGGRLAVAPFENAALATAGTGDVLAGTIGALLAQRLAPFDAACLGVYLHGAAAERLRDRFGNAGLIASDLLPEIPAVRRRLAELRDRPQHRVGFASRAGSA